MTQDQIGGTVISRYAGLGLAAHCSRGMLCLGILLLNGGCASTDKPPVHRKGDLIGGWTGFSEDLSYTCRVELATDQRGWFAIKFLDQEAAIYRLEFWNLRRDQIETTLRSLFPYKGAFQLDLALRRYNEMDCTISGIYHGSKWNIKARLLRESFVKDRTRSLENDFDRATTSTPLRSE